MAVTASESWYRMPKMPTFEIALKNVPLGPGTGVWWSIYNHFPPLLPTY